MGEEQRSGGPKPDSDDRTELWQVDSGAKGADETLDDTTFVEGDETTQPDDATWAGDDSTVVGDDSPSVDELANKLRKPTPLAGESIGPYSIIEILGEGGMGVVYRAEQTQPVRREVALKVIKRGMDTDEVVKRFEAERQALAVMDHPAIAQVYDAGATDNGRPFFVMELVRGTPLAEYCDEKNLTTRKRLELFIKVCRGVQHAHQKGVTHRDLKPSNIIVSEKDGEASPKIIDFGIAKATAEADDEDRDDRMTSMGQLLGTPEYMSPEQADFSDLDVDTRSDIYSLGVILYEILTGELPFDPKLLRKAGIVGMHKIIRDQEPPKPSTRFTSLGVTADEVAKFRHTDTRTLTRQLRGDLDWIVLKALEKDRDRRYQTGNAFAMDIQRFLDSEPVLARPPSNIYRVRKFVRRNKLGVAMGAVIAAVLVFGLIGTAVGFVRAQAEASRVTAVNRFLINMLDSVRPENARGRDVTVREVLDEAALTVGEKFEGEPALEATIRAQIGNMYSSLGHYDQAEPHLERALDLRRQQLGELDEVTLRSINQIAVNLLRQQKFEQAREMFDLEVRANRRILGPLHEDTLTSLQNLAAALLSLQKWDEAEPLLLETLEGRREVLGPQDNRTLSTIANLAYLYRKTDRPEQAEPLFVEALEARREKLGDDHPRTVVSVYNLADFYREAGNLDRAVDLYAQSVEGFSSIYKEDHDYTLRALVGHGRALAALLRFDEAEPVLREAMRVAVSLRGEGHLETVSLGGELGRVLVETDKPEDAEPLLDRAVAMLMAEPEGADDERMAPLQQALAKIRPTE